MSSEVVIRIRIPDNAEVTVEESTDQDRQGPTASPQDAEGASDAERYWRSLSDNSQKLFSAMARQQMEEGPFTYEDVGERLGLPRETLYSYRRVEGRTRNKWERENGSKAPFKPLEHSSVPDRQIKRYYLPEKDVEAIISLSETS